MVKRQAGVDLGVDLGVALMEVSMDFTFSR